MFVNICESATKEKYHCTAVCVDVLGSAMQFVLTCWGLVWSYLTASLLCHGDDLPNVLRLFRFCQIQHKPESIYRVVSAGWLWLLRSLDCHGILRCGNVLLFLFFFRELTLLFQQRAVRRQPWLFSWRAADCEPCYTKEKKIERRKNGVR